MEQTIETTIAGFLLIWGVVFVTSPKKVHALQLRYLSRKNDLANTQVKEKLAQINTPQLNTIVGLVFIIVSLIILL